MKTSILGACALVFAAALAVAPAAQAQQWDHDGGGYDHRDYGGGYDRRDYGGGWDRGDRGDWHHRWYGYYAPPDYYYPPPQPYYAPPPVYYAPPPVYVAPPVITFGFQP